MVASRLRCIEDTASGAGDSVFTDISDCALRRTRLHLTVCRLSHSATINSATWIWRSSSAAALNKLTSL